MTFISTFVQCLGVTFGSTRMYSTCTFYTYFSFNNVVWIAATNYLIIIFFYPTAFKACRGIVFTQGDYMGGRAGRRWEKVCPDCISETVRCRKLIIGRDIG